MIKQLQKTVMFLAMGSILLITSCIGGTGQGGGSGGSSFKLKPQPDYAPQSIIGYSFHLDNSMMVTFKENNTCSVMVPGIDPSWGGTLYVVGKPEYRYKHVERNIAQIEIAYNTRIEYLTSGYSTIDYIYRLRLEFSEDGRGYASGEYTSVSRQKYSEIFAATEPKESTSKVPDRAFTLRNNQSSSSSQGMEFSF